MRKKKARFMGRILSGFAHTVRMAVRGGKVKPQRSRSLNGPFIETRYRTRTEGRSAYSGNREHWETRYRNRIASRLIAGLTADSPIESGIDMARSGRPTGGKRQNPPAKNLTMDEQSMTAASTTTDSRKTTTESRIQRVRHDLKRRHPTVTAVTRVSPGFIRVSLAGDDLKGFPSMSFDDHVKVFVPTDGEPVMRDYTPRSFDAEQGTMDIEFAIHEGGAACDWASQLKAGDTFEFGGPKGSMIVPMDYDWHLLIGDPTSLPAISRRLEELPAGSKVIAVIQVENEADQREFDTCADADIHWVSDYDQLLATVQELTLPAGEGFAWAGAEGNVVKSLRQILITDKGHPQVHSKLSSYWKSGAQGFAEKG